MWKLKSNRHIITIIKKPFCFVACNYNGKLSSEQKNLILSKLNNLETSQLSKYLAQSRCKKLIAYRKKHGPFENLNQLLLVEGFGENVIASLASSLLNLPPTRAAKSSKPQNYILPEISTRKMNDFKTVVGLSLENTTISWAGIELRRDGSEVVKEMFNWDFMDFAISLKTRKHHELQLLDVAYNVAAKMPEADAYVMESHFMSGGISQLSNSFVSQQKLQLSAMLLPLLNGPSKERSRVYLQKNLLWCRLYGTLIGSEKVSTVAKLDEIFAAGTELVINDEFKVFYKNHSPFEKQVLGTALLMTLCFINIGIFQDIACIKKITGNRRNNAYFFVIIVYRHSPFPCSKN